MDRHILDYLPLILKEPAELKALMEAEQPEIELLWIEQDYVLANLFVLSASEYGIRRWEKILKIYPQDTDSLEIRRMRVLLRLLFKPPYTRRWLYGWLLDIYGEGNFTINITDYIVDIDLLYDNIKEADELTSDFVALVQDAMPENMMFDFNILRETSGAIRLSGSAETVMVLEVRPEPIVLESAGGIVISAYTEYLAYAEAYPQM